MKITDALLGEHAIFYALFDQLEQTLSGAAPQASLQALAPILARTLVSHARLEDDQLFSSLDQHLPPDGPLAVMRAEHEEIEGNLQGLEQVQDPEELGRRISRLVVVARAHFKKEEQILFPLAEQCLGDTVLRDLGGKWASARGVTLA